MQFGAQPPREALGQDRLDACRDHEGRHAHVGQARDGRGRVVGVDGGEDQVAGHGRLHGDVGGLLVADLADHDDVGVEAQERAQGRGEIELLVVAELHVRVDRDLDDAVEVVLDRVLGGQDLDVGAVDVVEGRVEGGGLARAGRAADQDQAEVLLAADALQQAQELVQGVGHEAHLLGPAVPWRQKDCSINFQ